MNGIALKNNSVLLIAIILISSVLLIRDLFGIGINQYIIFLLMTSTFAILSPKETLLYMAFTCGIITGVNGYILLVGMFFVLYKDRIYLRNHRVFLIPFFVLFLWELFNGYSYVDSPQIGQFILYGGHLLVFFYYSYLSGDKDENKDSILFYSIGTGVSLLIISAGVLQNPTDLVLETETNRAALGVEANDSATHFSANANSLAYFSIVLISILLSLRKTVFNKQIIFWSLLIVALLAGALSRSRTWMLLGSLFLFSQFLLLRLSAKLKAFVVSIVLMFSFFYFFPGFMNSIVDAFAARFEEGNLSTAGNRTVLFKEYMNFMSYHSEYQVFGTGAVYYKDVTSCSNSCHNALQQIYISYGILGCMFFMLIFYNTLRRRNKSINVFSYMPYLTAFIFMQSIQLLNPFSLMLPLALSSLAFKLNNNNLNR